MTFNQNNTPSALDQLMRRGKYDSLVTTLSRSFNNDPVKVTTVTNLFRSTEHPDVRLGSLFNPELVTQFLFVTAGQVFPLTRPCVATNTAQNAVYIGNMSDELGMCVPIQVSADDFTGWFTSVISDEDATDFSLPRFQEPPDTLAGKPTEPGAGDGEAESMARLNFGPDAVKKNHNRRDAGDHPVAGRSAIAERHVGD